MRNYFVSGALIALAYVVIRTIFKEDISRLWPPLGWADFLDGMFWLAALIIGTVVVGGSVGVGMGWLLERERRRQAQQKPQEAKKLPQ